MAENFFGITDVGRQRTNNEDAFIAQKIWNESYIMACVIDGVGGYEGGEVAAQLASETVQHYFSIPSGDITTMMQEALVAADEKIREAKRKKEHLESMACVLTLALVDVANHVFYYAHVGDTRLYLYRDGALVKITKDHSFVGFLEDNGRISEEAAMAHPKRNEIDKALGFSAEAALKGAYIELGQSPFLPGDALLLCSDGLSDMLTSAEMIALYQNGKTLADKGRAMIDAANRKGGKDNITVVLVQNNSKPVKQKRTKPVPVKKNSSPQQKRAEQPAISQKTVMPAKTKNYKNAFWAMLLLSLALAGTTAYLLWQNKKRPATVAAPAVFVQSEGEQKLVDTLQHLTGDTLQLSSVVFGNNIALTDTLLLAKDSLHLFGHGTMVLEAAPGFTGPAIVVPKGISNIFLDSLVLKHFETGILAGDATLHLKGVRFVNCAVPVQFALHFPDSMAVSGTIKNGRFEGPRIISKTFNQ